VCARDARGRWFVDRIFRWVSSLVRGGGRILILLAAAVAVAAVTLVGGCRLWRHRAVPLPPRSSSVCDSSRRLGVMWWWQWMRSGNLGGEIAQL
jgi:hypothetical protein